MIKRFAYPGRERPVYRACGQPVCDRDYRISARRAVGGTPHRRVVYGPALAALLLLLILPGCHKKAAEADAGGEAASSAPVAVELATAEQQTIEVTVRGQGTLAAGQGAMARVAAPIAGRLISVRVTEGERVRAGQVVAVIDNRPAQAQAQSAKYALSTSEAMAKQSEIAARAAASDQNNGVKVAQIGLNSAKTDRANSVQQALTAVTAAQTDLRKLQAGARPQEIAQAEQAVTQARATRDRAQTELERVQFLNERGIAPKRQLDDATTALAVASSALETAQQAASLTKAGARAEDLQAAQIRVQQAQEAQRAAETSGSLRIMQAEAALRQAQQAALSVAAKQQDAIAAQRTVAQKQSDFIAAQETARYAEIHAPLDGVVTRRNLNPGDMADTTNPILEISNPQAVNLVANLTAEDGRKVRAGMAARILSTDTSGQAIPGRVLSVGQIDPQTSLLAVRIALNRGAALKAGQFASVEIIVRQTRAVVAPKQAVITREDKSVVYVIDKENTAHQREVGVGAEQGDNVEITKGLQAGEKIARLGQYELNDGAKIKEASQEAVKEGDKTAEPDAKKGGE